MGFERGRRGQVPLGTSGARGLGKLRGRGRSSSNSDPRDPLRPVTESTRSVPAPSRRGPPFTYELAHGGRVWVPVTLPERHGSARSRPGPPPPRLTTPPARPWLRPPGRTSPGRCEAPGSGLGPGGAEAGAGTRAPATSRGTGRAALGTLLGTSDPGADPAAHGARCCSSLRFLLPFVEKEIWS